MNRSSRPQSPRPLALWGLFFLSGAAALGYQIVWAKMFALTLGHEFPAIVAVVSTIFGGMAIGGAMSHRILKWLGPHAFARLEFAIGFFGMLTPLLVLKLNLGWFSILSALPAAIAMGATLPAMARLAAIPSAYAANTLGAVFGCLGAAYLLMPRLGLVTPIFFFAGANFAAAVLARRLVVDPPGAMKRVHTGYATLFFVTGFIGLGFELLGVRLLSMSLENTVFTFAAILAVYLLGQSLGAALIHIKPVFAGALLCAAMALSLWIFRFSGILYEHLRNTFGNTSLAVFGAELLTSLAVFALPTFFMGGLFAQMAKNAGRDALGGALFWNSCGAVLGAILVPTLMLPAIGQFNSLVRVPPGATLRQLRVGRMATVAVIKTPDGHRTLSVNNRFQMGGTAATIPELRHAHIPLLLHPAPRRSLVVGLGTGITLGACAAYLDLRADGVELLPEVVAVMPHFFTDQNDSPTRATNITIHIADARRFIRETTNEYDVIIADLFHPAQDGAGFLYTREHFHRMKSRLAAGGLFCQWLPLHQLDTQTFRSITRTFLDAFPNAQAWLLRPNIDAPAVGLIGYKSIPTELISNLIDARVTNPILSAQLRRVALADSVRLFGSFLAGPDSLRAFSGKARINTDTFPVVMFEAPAFSYQHNAPTHERLVTFLREISDRVPPLSDTNLHARVARYISARDIYLHALVAEAEKDRTRAIDGYIESARLSEDFTSGYAQCLAIATAESRSNPTVARQILERLVEAQPQRPVAKELLDRLNTPR